jgi:KUP system potassium uptake protein
LPAASSTLLRLPREPAAYNTQPAPSASAATFAHFALVLTEAPRSAIKREALNKLAQEANTMAHAASTAADTQQSSLTALAVAAIGVVYGDIGTSPLYTMKAVFTGPHAVLVTEANVLGILSLIFWALLVVVSLKYVVFIMRADNHGEGGIMALTALALRKANAGPRQLWLITMFGMFGAALFYGDGVITPAISVLSAVEGLEVATPLMAPYVIPVTVCVLVVLFVFQRKGTAAVGALFGPVMCAWFAVLAILGVMNIVKHPSVLAAASPLYAFHFVVANKGHAFLALGAVVLALTGAEALYADMGHFGRRPIKLAWFLFVFPAVFLNYLGRAR